MRPPTSLVSTCVCDHQSCYCFCLSCTLSGTIVLLLLLFVLHSVWNHPCYCVCLFCTLSPSVLLLSLSVLHSVCDRQSCYCLCLSFTLWPSVFCDDHSCYYFCLWPWVLAVTVFVLFCFCRALCPRRPVLLLLISLCDHQPCFYFCLWPSDLLLFLSVLHSVITVVLRILSVSLHPGSVSRFVEIVMEKASFYMQCHGHLFALLADSSTVWQS